MKVIISVDQSSRPRISEIAKQLAAAGLQVDAVLGSLGVITGSAPDDKVEGLRRVRGVEALEVDRQDVAVPTPGDEVQ